MNTVSKKIDESFNAGIDACINLLRETAEDYEQMAEISTEVFGTTSQAAHSQKSKLLNGATLLRGQILHASKLKRE